MKLYTAPLEGITGYVFRNAFHQCFGNADKYFIPFIQPNQKGHFSSREKQDVKPENNQGMYGGSADPYEFCGRFFAYRMETEKGIRISGD